MRKVIALLTLTLIILSGCKASDISKKSFVVGMGVDLAGEDEMKLTLQIAKPFSPNQIGKQGTTENAFWVNSTTGKTIFSIWTGQKCQCYWR